MVDTCLFDGVETEPESGSALEGVSIEGTPLDGTTIDGRELGGQDIAESALDGPNAVAIAVPRITFPRTGTPTSEISDVELPSFGFPGATLRQSDRYTIFSMGADVLFDFDLADLRLDAQIAIAQIAEAIMQNCAGLPMTVHGHTDAMGSASYNLMLSQARAESVRAALAAALGLVATDLGLVGHGETDPAAPNTNDDGSDNPSGRQLNRRVEIWVDRRDGLTDGNAC